VRPEEEAAAQADAAMAGAFDSPAPEPAPSLSAPGRVRLAPVPPLASVTLPGAGPDGTDLVITEEGAEMDEATAEHAREVAWLSGLRLREI
jgi:hypothetical protein